MVQVVDTRDQGTGADRVTDPGTHPTKEQNPSSLRASGMSLHQQDSIILVCADLSAISGLKFSKFEYYFVKGIQ